MFLNRYKNSAESKSFSIGENGQDEIDKAFFAWAIYTLNPRTDLKLIEQHFNELKTHYHGIGRFFHKGLGHSRSLFSKKIQKIYEYIYQNIKIYDLITVIKTINAQVSENIVREAQQILAAFYHDVIHRNDKTDIAIESTLILFSMLDKKKDSLRVEELSCIVAERALIDLQISPQFIIPILLAIMATIPFSVESQPSNLLTRLLSTAKKHACIFTESDCDSIIEMALATSYLDLSSYAEDNLDTFNQKSWAMMYERNRKIADDKHTLAEEAEGIYKLYENDRQLLTKIESKQTTIYEIYERSANNLKNFIKLQNRTAVIKIKDDLILQGLQLGSLSILISLLTKANSDYLTKPLNLAVKHQSISDLTLHCDDYPIQLPGQIVKVLQNHDKICTVNGITIKRGSINASYTLKFSRLFGMGPMLEIANAVKTIDGQLQFPHKEIDNLLFTLNKPINLTCKSV